MNNYVKHLVKSLGMLLEDAELFISGFKKVVYLKNDFLLKKGDKSNVVKIIIEGLCKGVLYERRKRIYYQFLF